MTDDLRKEYLEKINAIPAVSFNKEQKAVAEKILAAVDEKDLNAVFGLITQRVKTGFVFDMAPEVNHGCAAVIAENKDLDINVNELEVTEHKLIIGENYDALKNLRAVYRDKNGKGKIDVIYIDPPYNTEASKADGNDYKDEVAATKFAYRDKFTRDGWLNMMNERLKLAKDLLSDKGVIFISIDDSEQAYLKVLCDEIFGEDNFVANFIVVSAPAGTQSSVNVSVQHSYCVCYAKKYSQIKFLQKRTPEELKDRYTNKDSGGNFYCERLWKRGVGGRKEDVPTLHFPVYFSPHTNDIKVDTQYNGESGYVKIIPYQSAGVLGRWTWSRDTMLNNKNKLIVKKVAGEYKLHKKVYENEEKGKLPFSIIGADIGRTEIGGLELKKIFSGNKVFDYPKPVSLIKHLISIATQNKDALVLDFYAGSGTTGQAVMELNAEDGGHRRFILVTNNENGIGENITRERLYRVINGKGSRGESIEWKYSADKPCLSGNSVRVFGIRYHQLSLNELDKAEQIKKSAAAEFKNLDKNYNYANEFDVYNDLAALNPYKKEDEK